MARIDKKLEQIDLQHQIMELLRNDNGVTSHFDYHVNLVSENETVLLNLLTFNPRHEDYMLFHTTKGNSSIDCLKKMIAFIKTQLPQQQLYSYTIIWKKWNEQSEHISYFRAADEQTAIEKFLHEKNPEDYRYSVTQNPIS
jgi:hypothetical protein